MTQAGCPDPRNDRTKFELVIDLKITKALGLSVSPRSWRSPTR